MQTDVSEADSAAFNDRSDARLSGRAALARMRALIASGGLDDETVLVSGSAEASTRVLCVDDDPGVCYTFLLWASGRADLEAVVVMSKRLALGLVTERNEHFDAFVIDPQLRDGSGYDLARQLREEIPRAPIVYLSGSERSPARAAEAQHVVGDDFLIKPLDLAQLDFAVRKAIELRRLRACELRQPPLVVRLQRESTAPLAPDETHELARLDARDAEVFVRRKRVQVTTSTVRLLVRLMLTPELAVQEPELRPLFKQAEEPKGWTNLVAKTAGRLRGQLERASPGAGDAIGARRGEGYVFRAARLAAIGERA